MLDNTKKKGKREMSREVHVLGNYRVVTVLRVNVLGINVHVGKCPGVKCPGREMSWGKCPGGKTGR